MKQGGETLQDLYSEWKKAGQLTSFEQLSKQFPQHSIELSPTYLVASTFAFQRALFVDGQHVPVEFPQRIATAVDANEGVYLAKVIDNIRSFLERAA